MNAKLICGLVRTFPVAVLTAIASSSACAFFPVCLDNPSNPQDYPLIKAAGFNCVSIGSPSAEMLSEITARAQDAGLKLILPANAVTETSKKTVLAAYGGAAGVKNIVNAANGIAAFGLVKQADFILLAPTKTDPETSARETGIAAGAMQLAGKESRTERIICRIPSDFSAPDSFAGLAGLRFAVWNAVASGAGGIFYGPADRANLGELGDLLATAAQVNAELAQMSAVVDGPRTKASFKTAAGLKTAIWKKRNRTYTALINTTAKPLPAPQELLSGKYRPLFEKNRDPKAALIKHNNIYFIAGRRVLLLES